MVAIASPFEKRARRNARPPTASRVEPAPPSVALRISAARKPVPLGLDVDRLEHHALCVRLGRVAAELGLDVGSLGEGAARGVLEVLAEVRFGEVRERAEPDADPGDARGPLRVRRAEDPANQVVHQGLLVHAATSSRTASATRATADSTTGLSVSPVSKLAPSIPKTIAVRGSRPRARAISTASARPKWCVDVSNSRAGSS